MVKNIDNVRNQLADNHKFIETKRNPDAATIKGKIVKFLNAVKKAPPATGRLGGTAAMQAPAPATME